MGTSRGRVSLGNGLRDVAAGEPLDGAVGPRAGPVVVSALLVLRL